MTINTFLAEKRYFPRINTDFLVKIENRISGKTINLSETGISFASKKDNTSKSLTIQIELPSQSFSAKLRVKWHRISDDTDEFLYGTQFLDLDNKTRRLLREVLFRSQIKNVLNKLQAPEDKKLISSFFLEDVNNFLGGLKKLRKDATLKGNGNVEIIRRMTKLNNEIVLKGSVLEELIANKNIMREIKGSFRLLASTWAYKSNIVKRAFEKPRGYPGDYRMMEDVYDNQPRSEGIGWYYDKYFLSNAYAVAVRSRKDKLREMLYEFIDTNKDKKSIKILDLACGSSREIAELIPRIKTKSLVKFTCIDWDEEAIAFSKELFKDLPSNVKVGLLKNDLFALMKNEKFCESLGSQDLIYSIGLIDYLPDRILKKWLQFFYQLLHKGGKFIVTHKNKEKTFPPLPPNWFCDWKFVPRSKDEVVNFLYNCGLDKFSLDIKVDDFIYIYYFTLTKQ